MLLRQLVLAPDDVGVLAEELIDGVSVGGRRALQIGVDRLTGGLVRGRFRLRRLDCEPAFQTFQRGGPASRGQHGVEHLEDLAKLVALFRGTAYNTQKPHFPDEATS